MNPQEAHDTWGMLDLEIRNVPQLKGMDVNGAVGDWSDMVSVTSAAHGWLDRSESVC